VQASGSKWQAQVTYAGKKHSLGGAFRTKEEAAAAYDTARQHKSEESGVVYNFESAEAGEEAAAMAFRGLETTAQRPRPRPATAVIATRLLETTAQRPRPRSKSGFYGVQASGSKWKAIITYAGKQHHLGTFRTKEEAAAAYDTAARQHRSEESGVVYNFASAEAREAAAAMSTRVLR
jgi:hypothetical protein